MDTLLYPGSRAVAMQLANSGYITSLWQSGVRVMENGCGACIGQGRIAGKQGLSLRTFNRNFPKRSVLPMPRYIWSARWWQPPARSAAKVSMPDRRGGDNFCPQVDDTASFVMPIPQQQAEQVEVVRGPNIMALPDFDGLPERLEGEVL